MLQENIHYIERRFYTRLEIAQKFGFHVSNFNRKMLIYGISIEQKNRITPQKAKEIYEVFSGDKILFKETA